VRWKPSGPLRSGRGNARAGARLAKRRQISPCMPASVCGRYRIRNLFFLWYAGHAVPTDAPMAAICGWHENPYEQRRSFIYSA
jgi:hypothetical protein